MSDSTTKRCTKCGQDYPKTTAFFQTRGKEGGLKSACRDCERQRLKQYYADHTEEMIERAKKWAKDHPEQMNEKNRRWRMNHAEQMNEIIAKWEKRHPNKRRAYTIRRRARIRKAEGTHTAEDEQRQYQAQHGKCYWCGKKVGKKYDVDHIVPLSRGGTNWPDNICITCPRCNRSKNDKTPEEWARVCGRLL